MLPFLFFFTCLHSPIPLFINIKCYSHLDWVCCVYNVPHTPLISLLSSSCSWSLWDSVLCASPFVSQTLFDEQNEMKFFIIIKLLNFLLFYIYFHYIYFVHKFSEILGCKWNFWWSFWVGCVFYGVSSRYAS